MTDPRFGAGDLGPGASSPGPSSFAARRPSRRPIAFPGRVAPAPPSASPSPIAAEGAGPPDGIDPVEDARASAPVSSSPIAPEGATPPAEFASVAARVFGDRLALAEEYARLLVTDGVVRGLIGPREAPRIWERHLVNCAVLSEILPNGASVTDVGSGAGLPGIVLAVARPDLRITLVEPLARRTAFLQEAVDTLGLGSTVTVLRGRADEVIGGPAGGADIVTARAVAPLDRLAGWCLPLARVGGRLLALKGASAGDEVVEHRDAVAQLGGAEPVIRLCGDGLLDPPATVVEIVKVRDVVRPQPKPSTRTAGSSRNARGNAGGRDDGRRRTRRG